MALIRRPNFERATEEPERPAEPADAPDKPAAAPESSSDASSRASATPEPVAEERRPPAAKPSPRPATPKTATPAAQRPAPASPPPGSPGTMSASASADLRQRLHRSLIQEIDQAALSAMPEEEARSFVQQAVRQLIDREVPAGRSGFRERLQDQLVDDVLGLGPLEPLLRDKSISEIMVNGPDHVYVERSGKLTLADVHFQDNSHVIHVIERILAPLGRVIDESSPMVDARLADGSRVNAVIPPASIVGPLLTIRKFVADRLTAEDLVAGGSLTQEAAAVLGGCVHAGLNIIVSGGTGSGKTTMLNVLSSWIPADQRIVTIEDPAELSLRQPHVVSLEARPSLGGHNAITQRDLLRNSLRMRPDRIVVGEVRGSEAFDMLQAMNTGHEGSMSTVHANSPRDALSRIENMVMMAGFDLPQRAIREQISSAIHLVLQVARMRDGSRRTVAISEVVGMEDQTVTMQDLFVFEHRGEDESGSLLGVLKSTGLRPTFIERLEDHGVDIASMMSVGGDADDEERGWAA